ncbi:ribonuclease H-like domain-containing protein [Tanacetum coccineum]
MASHRSKSLYAIKECSTCGRLYIRECCSIGNLEDKILVPVPDSSPRCARCGTPVDGSSCRGCAFLRKKFDEDLLTYCVENGIFKDFQDTSESFDDNTNVVNALREPSVVNQDLGIKSSQEPSQIDHNCCYECGDSLDGVFCQQCICKFCGKGAHYGYNCPPKVPIISNPEKCNQTINELPQILPNENSFNYDSKPHSFNVSPSVLTYPPQLQFENYLCELCGNNANYGYDCSPQFSFVYEQDSCYNQNFNDNYFPQNSQSYSQQYLCFANCRSPHETFQCQPMNEDYYFIFGDAKKFEKKEQAYEEEKYSAACRYMLSVTCDDEDDYIPLGDIIFVNLHPSKLNMSGSQDEIPPPPTTPQTAPQQAPHTEVIQKGNGPVSVTTDTDEVIRVLPPRTAKETLAREKRTKRHGPILLMALPEDHLAKFHKMTDAKEMWDAIKSRFGGNDEYKKMQEEPKALVTVDGEGVDWTNHSEEDEDYALMACNGSDSDTEVTSCSTKCKESYVNLKKLYDAQREQLSDASIEIKAYSQGLKKVEAQLVAHQQGQLWYEQKIKFMKIDLDDKTDVLTYHKKLLAEAQKEKDDLKAKVEKWQNSSKNLGKLLNSQMSAYDKFGLGYGDHRYNGILSYENEVLQSVFKGKESDFDNPPLNDKSVKTGEMHVVPPPMTGNYMPSGPEIEIDYSQFTYGPKQTQPSESESQSSEFDTCESNISAEPSELVSEPVVNESNVECQPKVWSDAPIIEEYESDSEDECVSIPTKQQETPSFANKQVKTPRENVKSHFTHSQKPKVDKKDMGHGFTVRACFVCGSLNHLIRDCDFYEKRMARKAELNNGWNNVQRVNKQNQFVPSAVLTRTGIIPVNTARTSGTKNFSTARQSVNRQTVLTSTAMKVNTVKPIVNKVRPANVFHKTLSPSSRPFKRTTVLRTDFSKQKVNTAKDYPHRALKNKGIIDSGCSRHMTGNKAYLAEFQDFNGGPCFCIKIQIGWILGRISASEEAIGTKWVYQNKKDKRGVVVRNKARLVAQGHRQEEDSLKKTQNSDYARANLDRKSTTGEAEYVAASKLLWASFCGSKSNVKTMDDKVADPTNQEAFELNGRIATSQNNNNSRHIIAKVAGKPVSISDASIRSDLLFDDANGIDSLPNQTIFDAIQLMRSQLANSTVPLYHFPVNALTNEGSPFRKPSEAQPTPSLTHPSEVPIVPQTDSSPTHPSEKLLVESWEVSDQAKEIQYLKAPIKKLKKQAKPIIKHHRAWMQSGRKFAKGEPSVHRDPLFDEIPEEDYMETENAQDVGRTSDIVGEEKENDKDVLSTEDVLSTNKEKLSTDKKKVSTDRPIVSTEGSKVSTVRQIEGTDRQIEGTDEQRKDSDDHTEEGSATQTTQPPPTSTIFRDDETIAKVLLNMSQAKEVTREKEKGVELKDIEETGRPRPTSTRSLLTLKHVPNIDPKDKGKKKIEEEDESESESDEKIKRSDEDFISIGSAEDERLIKKMNEKGIDSSKNEMIKEESKEEDKEETPDEEKEVDKAEHLEEINQNVVIRSMYKKHFSTLMRVLSIFDRDDLNAIYQLVMDKYQDEIPKGFDRLHGSSGVHTLVTEAGLVIHMLVEKKYPLRKKVLLQMLELKLESEEDSTKALELIRFVKKLVAELEPEDSNGDEEDL